MTEFKDYREAMKSCRRSQNFARKNYALPFLAFLTLPKVVAGLKVIASLILSFTIAKDLYRKIVKEVPYFFSRLNEYRERSKKYAKDQEILNQKRDQVMRSQKRLQSLIKDVGQELANIMKKTGNPRYDNTVNSLEALVAWMKSPQYQAMLEGKPITDEAIQKQGEVLATFMESYEKAFPEDPQGFLHGMLTSFLPAAGYMTGGVEAVNNLTAELLTKRAALKAGTLAELGTSGAIKTLGAVNKMNSIFFSIPMVCVTLAASVGGSLIGSALDSKIENLATLMSSKAETLEQLDALDNQINITIAQFKNQFKEDIANVRQIVLESSDTSNVTKSAILKNLDKLDDNLSRNFSVVTEAAGTLVKTGIDLLKNKTFDTALLGVITGMAIEKYKNKKEEELANKLLTEEANKMKKFRLT